MGLSLRAQLLRWLMPPLLMMLVIAGFGAYFIIHKPTTSAYDQALTDAALALSTYVRKAGSAVVLDFSPQAERVLRTDRYDEIYYSVLGPGGDFAGGDAGLPGPPPDASPEEGRIVYDAVYHGKPIRAAALRRDLGGVSATVIVAETTNKRHRVTLDTTFGMLVPEILLALGLAGVVWFGVGRGLAPLAILRGEIQARSHLDLRPLDESQTVNEVRPLVAEMNELLQRLRESGDAQQRFIANAAHQLRTPLAGLQTQLELALEEADPRAQRQRLEMCLSSTQRTARLVNQLLTLTAAEPGGRGPDQVGELDLAALLQDAASPWVRRAVDRGIDFGLELDAAPVRGDWLLLGELAANLVDNALSYTPSGGRITVRCGVANGRAYLSVADSGPGIPEAARRQVVERFFRLPGTAGAGSGLGLAIVREIVHKHDASLEITDTAGEPHGTTVMVRFPPPAGRRARARGNRTA